MLSVSATDPDEFQNYVYKNLLPTFGTHIITEDIKKEFLQLLCNIVNNHTRRDDVYYTAYDQLINSVDTDKKQKIEEFILKNTSSYYSDKFYNGYDNGNFLPF